MILSYIFLFLFILISCGAIFYLYDFFIPSLKSKYEIVFKSLATITHDVLFCGANGEYAKAENDGEYQEKPEDDADGDRTIAMDKFSDSSEL